MTDISVPSSLDGVEPVQSVRTPIRLEYTFTPGVAAQTYLREFANKKILGVVSPVDGAVLVPPRGADSRHGALCDEFIDKPHTGHVGSFCVTNVPIPGRELDLPYISAWIFLDGADIGFLNLVAECPPEECRIGMRVEAVWKPDEEIGMTAENILYWRPTGEPDIPFGAAGVRGWHVREEGEANA